MATVEELLETLISIETEIKLIEEGQTFQGETITSDIQTLTSEITEIKEQINILSSGQIDETTPNYISTKLDLINASQGAYISDQVLENNALYYEEIVSIKEMFSYQFIFIGVMIAFFIVILVIKGFFKHVSS